MIKLQNPWEELPQLEWLLIAPGKTSNVHQKLHKTSHSRRRNTGHSIKHWWECLLDGRGGGPVHSFFVNKWIWNNYKGKVRTKIVLEGFFWTSLYGFYRVASLCGLGICTIPKYTSNILVDGLKSPLLKSC